LGGIADVVVGCVVVDAGGGSGRKRDLRNLKGVRVVVVRVMMLRLRLQRDDRRSKSSIEREVR
jgi:hypothetical protein